MGPKKWPTQTAFTLFQTKKQICEELTGQRIQALGAQLGKNLNKVWAWSSKEETMFVYTGFSAQILDL